MKKISKSKGDMLPDYDFSAGMRGKYAKSYAKGSNVVVLDPDVAKVFADSKSVNRSLRNLAKTLEFLK
jgi:urate oxidase